MIDLLTYILLFTATGASGIFAIVYLFMANLKLKISRQILTLNFAIAGVLSLTILRRFHLLPADIVLYGQMFLFVFINAALLYQFQILRQARKLLRKNNRTSDNNDEQDR